MELDAFTSRLGLSQGRIESSAGEVAFVLGDAEPGRFYELRLRDYVEVVQAVDLTKVDLVRARLRLRVPAGIPVELTWEAAILVDGQKLARCRGRPGRLRMITDLAANVSKLKGEHAVGVRLELVRS